MRVSLLNHLVAADIKDAELLVTASGGDQGTVVVPGDTLNDLHVSSDLLLLLSLLDVPEAHGQVGRGRQEHVLGHGVEEDLADLASVGAQADHGLNVDLANLIGDGVDEDLAVLGTGGDQVIVEGREVGVEDGGGVSAV